MRRDHPFHCWATDWEQGRLFSSFCSKTVNNVRIRDVRSLPNSETGVRKGYFPLRNHPECEIIPWFVTGLRNHRSPPVCFWERSRADIPASSSCAEDPPENRRPDERLDAHYPGYNPRNQQFLHMLAQNGQTEGSRNNNDRMNERKDHCAQHGLHIGDLPRVLLVLSDLSPVLTGKSGVTLRAEVPSPFTPLGTLTLALLSTQGNPPS